MTTSLAKIRGKRWTLALEWKSSDLWVGAYWARSGPLLNVWLCLLPCLPLHVQWMRSAERARKVCRCDWPRVSPGMRGKLCPRCGWPRPEDAP